MLAHTTTGRIVRLKKDCGCITHTGPHWRHMEQFERNANREILGMAEKQRQTMTTHTDALMVHVLLNRFAELEIVRLDYYQREMQQQGILRLIEE